MAPADGEAVAALRRLDGVSAVSPGAEALTLILNDVADTLPAILRVTDRLGIRVDSLTVQQPNLEDVALRPLAR